MSALAGKRVVITRASHQAAELEQLLCQRDAIPLMYPCISIIPPENPDQLNSALQDALDGKYHWLLLTSTNTVRALKQSLDAMKAQSPYTLNLQIAAVGSATAHYAEEQLGLKVNVIPERYSADTLAQAVHIEKDSRVLLPQSEIAEPLLTTALSDMGANVTAVVAYQTVIGSGGVELPALLATGEVDTITLTSSSTVTNLLQRIHKEDGDASLLDHICIACIGSSTAATARKNNLPVTVMPDQSSLDELVTALEHYYAELALGESK